MDKLQINYAPLSEHYIPIIITVISQIFIMLLFLYLITFVSSDQYILFYAVVLLLSVIIFFIVRGLFFNNAISIKEMLSSFWNLNLFKKWIIFGLIIFTIINLTMTYRFYHSIEQSKIALLVMSLASLGGIVYAKYLTHEKITLLQIMGAILLLTGLFFINKF